MSLIQAEDLHKSFGPLKAVEGLDLQVGPGQIYGLVGPDGAGKTTTMRLLCGALRPDAGRVTIGGYSMATEPGLAREQIGYLSQRFSLYQELTVLENLRFFAEVRGLSAAEWRPRSLEILEFVGLGEFVERRAGHLSGGMRQKLGLATALVHRPQVLLLDEPTGGVDPVTRQDFWRLLIRLVSEEGVAVLVSTPYMDEAVRCTRVGFMQAGRLEVEGPPDALRGRLQGRILELRGSPLAALRQAALADEGVEDVQTFGDRLHLRLRRDDGRKAASRLKKRLREVGEVDEIRLITPQLEDVFIALLRPEGAPPPPTATSEEANR